MKIRKITLLAIILAMAVIFLTGEPSTDKITRIKLSDHLSILYQKDVNSAISVAQIAIRGGKMAEKEGKKGLAYITTRLTLELQSRDDLMELMTFGSIINCNTFGDFTLITIRSLSQNFKESVKLFLKNFTDPLFSGIRIKPMKDSMTFKQKSEQDTPLALMYLAHFKAFYRDGTYSGSVYGTKESLKKIKGKDIKRYYKDYFNSGNMVVSVCSDLPESEIKEIFVPFAQKVSIGTPVNLPSSTGAVPEKKHIHVSKDKRQTIVSFAFLLPKIDQREFAAAFLLENLLGKGIGSELWYLRSHQELAYSVAADFTQYINSGILSLNLRTENNKKDRAFTEFTSLLERLQKNGINADQFEAARTHAAADYFRENESKDRKAAMTAYFVIMGLEADFFLTFPNTLSSITLEEFNKFLTNILSPENRVSVIVGPKDIETK